MSSEALLKQIHDLGPWHHDIDITEEVRVNQAFTKEELIRKNNGNVSFIDGRPEFEKTLNAIYPNGVEGKTFLDCACNCGAYCFYMRELGALHSYGFDVRDHWIDQAKFIQDNRTTAPTDNIEFHTFDLMRLPEKNLEPVDMTLFKGIFYHLADPIQGLKIAADLTKNVLWFNSAMAFRDDDRGMVCTFELGKFVMSGVHSLSWTPTGPRVIAMMLYWLGFNEVWHVWTRKNDVGPNGRMELVAAREPGTLDGIANIEGAVKMRLENFRNAVQADDEIKSLF